MKSPFLIGLAGLTLSFCALAEIPKDQAIRFGAGAADFQASDDYEIAGGIHAWKAKGQEGKLRATAIVLEKPKFKKVAIVACDVLMITRDYLDQTARQIEKETGIPFSNILINCTHTHSAPSTCTIHGYKKDERFIKEVQQRIVEAAVQANKNLQEGRFFFALGEETSVGANSRLLLSDNTIYWTGPFNDALRPTGPFDSDLPVFAFKDSTDRLKALFFNHSTHTIGSVTPGVRSPSFYGLAAQAIESERGAVVGFIEGASGSTHNLYLKIDDAMDRIKKAVESTLSRAEPQSVQQLLSLKRPFKFHVRTFDETREEQTVTSYCNKRIPSVSESVSKVFRDMRKELAPVQGQERTSWIQTILIGDVAIVGVPAEFFTKLGRDIKLQSPFPKTYVAELANDWIGYLPDREGHERGGYQTWTGFHSYAEPGTGERVVEQAVSMLKELHSKVRK